MKKSFCTLLTFCLLAAGAARADDMGKNAMSMDKSSTANGAMMKQEAADQQAMKKKDHMKKKRKAGMENKATTPDDGMSDKSMKTK